LAACNHSLPPGSVAHGHFAAPPDAADLALGHWQWPHHWIAAVAPTHGPWFCLVWQPQIDGWHCRPRGR